MNLACVKEMEQHVSSAGPCIHPPLKELVLHGSFDGSTPLLLACEEGHLDAVERIVQVWHVHINAAANFYHLDGFTHSKIEKATPLFVAALKGHIDIVRFLIRQGADVSATTSTQNNPKYHGLTPLHGALMECRPGQSFSDKCAESSLIVQLLLDAGADPSILASNGTPVWMRDFCGADATIALVNHGLNLNQHNRWDDTILHHWIQFPSNRHSTRGISEKEREMVVHLLIDKGANLMARDSKGFPPILASAESKTFNILGILLESDLIDRNDKIDALELAGALLLLRSGLCPENSKKADAYWKKALLLRDMEGPDPIDKIPLEVTSEWAIEWVTPDELKDVIEDPSQFWIQAMVTRLRVYSYRSCKAVQDFIKYEFSDGFFKDSDDYYGVVDEWPTVIHIQDLLLEILGVFLSFGPYEPTLWIHTEKLVRELTGSLATPLLPSEDELERISTSLNLILAADPNGRLELEYGFFAMLARLPNVLLHNDIRQFASPSARLNAGTLLYQACNRGDWKTLRRLLHLGADPNSSFYRGNRPLHIVAGQEEDYPANLLFEYGAQPYAINDEGETAVGLWMEKNCGGEGMQSIAWKNRPHWCRDTVPKLSGLAAKTIHTQGISCSHPRALPNIILQFLNNH